MPSHPLQEVEETGDAVVLTAACERLTAANARLIGGLLSRLAGEKARPRLLPDCRLVELLTAARLGRALALDKGLRAAGGGPTLANVRPTAHEVFRVSRLAGVSDIGQASAGSMPAVGDDAPASP